MPARLNGSECRIAHSRRKESDRTLPEAVVPSTGRGRRDGKDGASRAPSNKRALRVPSAAMPIVAR